MRTMALLTRTVAILALMTLSVFSQSEDMAAVAVQARTGHFKGAGFVYVMTNEPSGNAIVQFRRASDGRLMFVDREPTGGLGGTGNGVGNVDPLGSQDSLIVDNDGRRLLAVNAGSNELSSLGVLGDEWGDDDDRDTPDAELDGRQVGSRRRAAGLALLSKIPSGGTFPNSVALAGNLVYVLNARGIPNVTGFRLRRDGTLQPIPGSTRNLPGGSAAAPHDVRFSPDGTRLLVTEDGTNQIDVFEVDSDGRLTDVNTEPSSGPGPFGFIFGRRGVLVVTEAAAGAVSSYQLTNQNHLTVIDGSVPNGQMASCWISMTRRGHAFISNTASSTLSSYHVAADGQLTLVKAVAANTGSGSAPIDSALSQDGDFLYVLDSALGKVLIFRVNGNSLRSAGSVTGLPTTLQGIAAQ